MSEPPRGGPSSIAAPADDPSIPVLTERLTLPDLDIDFTLPPAQPAAPPLGEGTPSALEVPAPAAGDLGDGNRFEAGLREAVLAELSFRLPREVDAIVRRHMAGAIDAAVQRLAQETRIALANALHEMVERAVASEVERLRAPKR